MKVIRLSLLCLLALVLIPLGGLASAKNEYPGDGLYPIRVDGKWGYMDRQGAIVVTPQWAYAGPFENGYAVISDELDRDGIINRSDSYAIDPVDGYIVYGEEPASDIYDIRKKTGADELYGFFDTLSGWFAKPQWEEAYSADTAENRVMVWNGNLLGYADRRTGELVIPCVYGAFDESWFQEGFALVDAAGNDSPMDGSTYCLIDTSGNRLSLPEGILPVSGFHEGLAAVAKEDAEGNTKYGFVDTSGQVVIPPQFDNYAWGSGFQEGYCAMAMGDKWGHIDRTGAWVCPPSLDAPYEGYAFINGIAVIWWDQCNTTVVINTQGKILYKKSRQDCYQIYDYMENGLAFYEIWDKVAKETYDGLLDKSGNPILDAHLGYQLKDPYGDLFSEGLQRMSLNGKYGFIDETGSVAFPFIWDDAEDFRDGLAYVEKDGKMAYIDHMGTIIWQEP